MPKFTIRDVKAAANGDVHLDVWVLKEEANPEPPPDTIDVLMPNGHRTAVLKGAAVLAITTSSLTAAKKKAALLALFKQEVASWGVVEADAAANGILGLLNTLPVSVNL